MKLLWIFLLLAVLEPTIAFAKSCASLTQELARLRQDYHTYVTTPPAEGKSITFDELAAILDKIVALKHDMRKSECKIPPRPKFPAEKR